MAKKLQSLRGMKDILPDDFIIFRHIEEIARNIGQLYGYQEIKTPIVEYAEVFNRPLGDSSDVISKEMYNFLDRSGDNIALRPEFTASIVRAFISRGLQQNLPLKFFTTGPLFRYDRPQAGRQRQFHQINFEYLGAENPFSDAETIKLAVQILSKLNILSDVTLELSSLGCLASRKNYDQLLRSYFEKYYNDLSEDSKKRLDKNPLRILDSKNENDQKIVAGAPLITDSYTEESKKYFAEVKRYLDLMNIKYVVNPHIVRGLDYYCHTVFEFTTKKLGAQGTILAGGRYDGLVKLMGGLDTPAIGFAAGIERIAMMLENFKPLITRPVYVMPIGIESIDYAIELTDKLRDLEIYTILDFKSKIQKRMHRALALDTKYIIFVGEDEKLAKKYKLKDLDKEEEIIVNFNDLEKIINNN
ncbi:MAG: histidine--tRNA ligase [Rickettsiaceae bacterium]|nr:histidine--tRNA ligase [Rickettsiaceae bacterium]